MKQLLAVLLALALLPTAAAIGISPPSGQINFVPGDSGAFDVRLSNSLNHPIDVDVEIHGNLAKHLEVETTRINARSSAVATISYDLPSDIPPGPNTHRIHFIESYHDPDSGGVGARGAVAMKLDIWKPYPGRYAELTLEPRHVPEGDDTHIKYTLRSLGDQAISGDLEVRVRTPEGNLQDTLRENDLYLEADTTRERHLQVPSKDYAPGKYVLEGTFDYNAAVADTQETLIIGTLDVAIINLTKNYYKDQDINRFEVTLESLWNEPITSTSATVQLGSNTGATPAVTIPPFSERTLIGYWEADQDLTEGEHPALVTATFNGGEPVEKTFNVHVHNNTPQPEVHEPSQTIVLGTTDILFLLITLALVGYFFMHNTRKHQ